MGFILLLEELMKSYSFQSFSQQLPAFDTPLSPLSSARSIRICIGLSARPQVCVYLAQRYWACLLPASVYHTYILALWFNLGPEPDCSFLSSPLPGILPLYACIDYTCFVSFILTLGYISLLLLLLLGVSGHYLQSTLTISLLMQRGEYEGRSR